MIIKPRRWLAILLDVVFKRPAFIVQYPEGQRTVPLTFRCARTMRAIWGGKIYWAGDLEK